MQQEVERLRREAQKMDMKNKQKKRREGRGKEGESSKVSAGGLNRVPTWRRNVEHAKSNFKKNWR